MPHSYGYRSRTRHLFERPFRQRGYVGLSKYLTTYKVGDIVDIHANSTVHKGMPHKYYHGRTGTVFNVTPHAIGLEVSKQVRNRVIMKRINVRLEHVSKSRCREDFLARVVRNDQLRSEAKKAGKKVDRTLLKRQPVQPKKAALVKTRKSEIETIAPVKFEYTF